MRVSIAGLLGAVVMFVWASIAHGLTPLASIGLGAMPDEAPVVQAIQKSLGDKGGLYFFPSAAGMSGGAKAMAASPTGIIAYTPPGVAILSPRRFIVEFVLELIESVLAAAVMAAIVAGFGRRLAVAAVVGAIAGIATNFSYWNWYGFSLDYTLANAFIELMKFVFAGAAIAAFLGWRERKPA